jgi:pimeloyl-ACP methyl ester carboxylesterase
MMRVNVGKYMAVHSQHGGMAMTMRGHQHMATTTSFNKQSTTATPASYTTGKVTSRDGTTIGYRQLGHGPGVVLVHGAMESAQSHMQLAAALADVFTVYLPDRRGRGLSGPVGSNYGMQTEVEDLDALLTTSGAGNVFGVSAGGLICLQATLTLPTIRKAALYEPALIVNSSISTAFLPRYDREIAEGRVASALVTGMLGAQMGPPMLNAMPRWLLETFTSMGMKSEDKKAKAGDVTMRLLAPTLHYDFQLVAEMAETLKRYQSVPVDVLLLGGSKSPVYLKTALDALEKVLPRSRRIECTGLDHGGSSDASNTNRGGHPELVAQELRRFFV